MPRPVSNPPNPWQSVHAEWLGEPPKAALEIYEEHARSIVACLGPKTAETAREFGLRVDVQPESPDLASLVEALVGHATRLRAEGALPPPRKSPRRR